MTDQSQPLRELGVAVVYHHCHHYFISILQKTPMRLKAFKELACGQNIDPLSEDSRPHRPTPGLPGQWGTMN